MDNLFVQPAASDDGVALGAALAPYLDTDGRVPMTRMRHAYLGPESTDDEIEKALVTYKLGATRLSDPQFRMRRTRGGFVVGEQLLVQLLARPQPREHDPDVLLAEPIQTDQIDQASPLRSAR